MLEDKKQLLYQAIIPYTYSILLVPQASQREYTEATATLQLVLMSVLSMALAITKTL